MGRASLCSSSYVRRAVNNDPIHEEFHLARNEYSKAIHEAKTEHWMEWLETLDEEGVWTVNRTATGPASDGGRGRIPTLKVRDPVTKEVTREVSNNEDKGKLFYQIFFPRRTAPPVPVQRDPYPQAKWVYKPTSDEQNPSGNKENEALESDEIRNHTKRCICARTGAVGTTLRANFQGH